MGLSAACVHLRVGSGPEEHRAVAAAIRRCLTAADYTETSHSRAADRTLILHPASSGAWLTVFDSEWAFLDDLALRLSHEAGAEALCSSIEQSDAMRLALFRAGRHVDALASQGPKVSGRPELWAPLLESGSAAEQLRAILERPVIFAEDKLVALARLLGLNRDLCLAHVDELLDAPGRPVGQRLHFRCKALATA
jgi:hypothetical protein